MALTESGPVALKNDDLSGVSSFGATIRSKRSPIVLDRPGCKPGAIPPPNRVNTTQQLADLRQQFNTYKISAYIITSDDEHQVQVEPPFF